MRGGSTSKKQRAEAGRARDSSRKDAGAAADGSSGLSFSKVMTASYLKHKQNLRLGAEFNKDFIAEGDWMLVTAAGQRTRCEMARRCSGGTQFAEIKSAGWHNFVQTSGVRKGDELRFELVGGSTGRTLKVTVMGGQEQEEAAPSPSEDDSSEEEEEEAQPRQRRGSHSAQAQQRQQQQQGGAQDPQQRGKATRRQQAALGTAGKQAEAQRGAAREASQAAGKRKQQQQQQHPHHSGGGEGQQEGGRASKWARPSPTSPALEQQQGARGAASQGGAVTSRAARQPRQQHAPAEAAQLEQPAGSRQEPTAPQQQRGQQQGRSPTPAAAAAPLEVSPLAPDQAGPSSRAIEAAATQQQQPRQQQQQQEREDGAWLAAYADLIAEHGPAIAARRWLSAALADARGLEARSVQLRPHLQAVHDSILSTLCNTVEAGHNNSLLLVGERGGGKTLVVERALSTICARFNRSAADPLVAVVRLVGWAHSDDRVAFREMARQLCEAFRCTFSKQASIGENIEFLRGMLQALSQDRKVVVFLLDKFELFARKSRQSLLYLLLDALQTSGMQAMVVGVTHRQDVVEMLEKRVKSRFSHRILDVTAPQGVEPLHPGAGGEEGGASAAAPEPDDGMLGVLQAMLTLPEAFPDRRHAERHNAAVAAACADAAVRRGLAAALTVSPTPRHQGLVAETALGLAAAAGGQGQQQQLRAAHLVAALRQVGQQRVQGVVRAVAQLSVLELILLVAAARLRDKLSRSNLSTCDAVNFEMMYSEFGLYAGRGDHVDNYSKAAAAKAFEHLLSMELLQYVDARNDTRPGARQYAAVQVAVQGEDLESGLAQHWNCPSQLGNWLRKEAGLGTTAGSFLGV